MVAGLTFSTSVAAGGGGGTTFTGLTDTPVNYSGAALDILRVNAGATAVEFVDDTSDFLTQYALLAGRAGGQSLTGGTASGEDLTFESTSDATKGSIIFGTSPQMVFDEVNGRLGIGTASPGNNLQIEEATASTTPQIEINQTSTGDAAIRFSIPGDSYALGIDNTGDDNFKLSYTNTASAAVLGTNDRIVLDNSTGKLKLLGSGNPGLKNAVINPEAPSNATAGLEIVTGTDSFNLVAQQNFASGNLSWYYNGTRFFRLDQTNFRIGWFTNDAPDTEFHLKKSTTSTTPWIEIDQQGSGDSGLQFSITGDAYAVGIDNSADDEFKISYSSTSGGAVLGTNDRFQIDSAGEVTVVNSLALPIESVAVNTTLDATHHTVTVDASLAARTITLPALAGVLGRVYVIKKEDSSANTVTIDGNGAETIDGAATKVISVQYNSFRIQAGASEWHII